jgi:hypothetical protein
MVEGIHSAVFLEVLMQQMLSFAAGICQLALQKALGLFKLNHTLLSRFRLLIKFDHKAKIFKNIETLKDQNYI